jgi:glycopeptide antibiotics resistance protein
MSLFTSNREKRLWIFVILLVTAIYSTLGLALRMAEFLRNQDLQAVFFLMGMLFVGMTIVTQGLKVRPGGAEIAIAVGIVAVYFMAFTRITLLEERSHLIEYSVVAVFIYEALIERKSNGERVPYPAILAIILTSLIGFLDECIQLLMPSRVFDLQDILFNTLAAVFAVIAIQVLAWTRKRIRKRKVA